MVKKFLFIILMLIAVIFTNSCFIIYESFVYDSSIDERRMEMNNKLLVDTLPSLDTGTFGGYSFFVITDTHIQDGNYDGLERLSEIITEHGNIKFAVVLGDITDGEKKDYAVFMELAEELKNIGVPFYPVIGNHDLIGDGWKHWKNNIGATNYIVTDEANNAALIMLDSANVYYGKEQLNWLETQLKSVNTRDIFVFSHVSPFAQGYLLQIPENERARLVSILRNKCNIMFAGHTHTRYTHKTGGVEFVTVESYRDDRAYCIVTVTETGAVSYEFKKF